MRVLVVSEGKHEQAGALEGLLRQLGGKYVTFTFDRVANDRIHAIHGKVAGFSKRALRWLLEAEKRGLDALVFLIDQDGDRERSKQIADAQDSSLSPLPRAMGVAIRTFDAWMLADEKALTDALGCVIAKQSDPEEIRDPKATCAGLLTDGRNQIAQSEMYAMVADRVDIAVLISRCPRGFKPFAERVQRVFGRESLA